MSVTVEEYMKLQQDFLKLKEDNYGHKEKEKKLTTELEKFKDEVRKAQSTSSELDKCREDLKKALDTIAKSKKAKELEALKKENEQLTFSLQQANRENREQQNALRANIKTIYDSNDQLQQEVDKYKQTIKDLEKKQASNTDGDIVQRLQEQLNEMKKQEENHKKQIEILTSSLNSFSSNVTNHKEHDSPISIELNLDTFEKQIEKFNGTISTEQSSNEENSTSSSSTSMDKNALLTVVQSIWKEQVEGLTKEIEKRISGTQVDKFQELHQQFKKTENDYQLRIKSLEEQLTNIQDKHKHQIQELTSLEDSKIKDLSIQNEKANKLVQRKDEEITNLKEQLKKKVDDLTKTESDVIRFKEELSVVQQDRGQLVKKMTDKDLQSDKLRDEIQFHKQQAEKYKAQLDQATETVQKERENFTATLKQRVEQISKLSTENAEKTIQVTELEEKISMFKSSNIEFASQNKELNKKLSDLEENAEKATKDSKSTLASNSELKNKLIAMETALKTAEDRVDLLTRELESKKTNLSQTNEAAAALESNLDKMRQNWMTAKQNEEKLTAELQTKNQEVEKHEEQLQLKEKEKERLQKKHEKQIQKLQQQLSEQVEKTQQASQKHTEYTEQINKLELNIKILTEEKQKIIDETEIYKKSQAEKESELSTKLNQTEAQITDLKVQVDDGVTAIKLEKQNLGRLIKDLQNQISKDRASYEKQIKELQTQLSNTQIVRTSSEIKTPEKGLKKTPSSASVDRLALSPTPLPTKTMDVTMEVLQNDINQLAATVGHMQKEKWDLEEKIKKLEDMVLVQSEDIQKKEDIIKGYGITLNTGRANAEMDARRPSKRSVLGNKELTAEMISKMEAAFEDTLLKNMQLKNDLKTMGEDVAKLLHENAELKKNLSALSKTESNRTS